MRILELTNFTAGGCGVGARAIEESKRLAKKHEVRIFSTNFIKGKEKNVERAPAWEVIEQVIIRRFPAKKLGGESFMSWDFEKAALDYAPDLIIAHGYRHSHTKKAVKIAEKLKCKVFLVTHAPFIEGNSTRSFIAGVVVNFYDKFIGPKLLKKFNRVVAISKWEYPYLRGLGLKDDEIEYIPNGIPEEFFTQKQGKEEKKVLFLGRIAPIKQLESLIEAIGFLENKRVTIELVGPVDDNYLAKLKGLVKEKKLEKRIIFSEPIYKLKEKIAKIDSAKVFVLPSFSEAMPQALIEAMARGKIVVASKNPGALDLVEDGKNGFIFENGNAKDLARKLDNALSYTRKDISKNAIESVKQFSWNFIIEKIEKMIK